MLREGVVYGMSEDEYHGQGVYAGMFKDELSSTGAKKILEMPALYKYEILDGNSQHKKAFDVGTAVHAKVLGTESPVVVLDFKDFRTKAAQEARDDAYDARKVPMLKKDMAQIDGMTETVLAHGLVRKAFERAGESEVSMFAEDNGVKLRCRFDYLPAEGAVTVDLKTTAGKASKSAFERTAGDLGYHIQRSHYLDVLERVTGRVAEMVFVVVEKSPPYAVGVHQLNSDFERMGEREVRESRELFKQCMETGVWPAYEEKINLCQPPNYLITQFQEKYGVNA